MNDITESDDGASGADFHGLEAITDGSRSGSSASTPRQPSGGSTGVPDSGVQPHTPTTPGGSVGGASRGRKRSKKDMVSPSTFEMDVLNAFKEAKAAQVMAHSSQQCQHADMDDCDFFGREAACALRRLDAEKQLKFKIGFWKLIQEIEFGDK